MSSRRALLYRVITWTAGAILATFLVAIPARAQSNSGDYLFLVGSGFLCQSNDSSAWQGFITGCRRLRSEVMGLHKVTLSCQFFSVRSLSCWRCLWHRLLKTWAMRKPSFAPRSQPRPEALATRGEI